jgi:hypothetical protein
VINNNISEQVNSFIYIGYTIVTNNRDLEKKINRFNQLCSTIRRIQNNKTIKDIQIKFYTAMSLSTLTYASKIWTITQKTKNRNQN